MLRAACSGELVPTEAELARAEGREYEPACVLLERILAERRAHWDAQETCGLAQRRGKYTRNRRRRIRPTCRRCQRGGRA